MQEKKHQNWNLFKRDWEREIYIYIYIYIYFVEKLCIERNKEINNCKFIVKGGEFKKPKIKEDKGI